MAKYSKEFKLNIVKEYLEGPFGSTSLAKKYGVPNHEQIRRWVNAYKVFGEEGLKRKRSKTVYPVQFKLDVLNFMKQTCASYQDTATAFKMNQPTLITSWNIEFQKHGVEGLEEKSKGRVTMSAGRKSKRTNQGKKMSREDLLAHENEMLRLENAYLKKLKAFQENPNAFLEKHKQRWRSNSKKKDSN